MEVLEAKPNGTIAFKTGSAHGLHDEWKENVFDTEQIVQTLIHGQSKL